MPNITSESSKRLNYFNGQFLRADDFSAEQAYHLSMRRWHNRALHTWGIVDGLELKVETTSGTSTLTVTRGGAIDAEGREIRLADDTVLTGLVGGAAGGSTTDPQEFVITISHREQPSDTKNDAGIEGPTRVTEGALIEAGAAPDAEEAGLRLVLGRILVNPDGTIALAEDSLALRRSAGAAVNDLAVRSLALRHPDLPPAQWPRLSASADGAAVLSGTVRVNGNVIIQRDLAAGATTLTGALTVEANAAFRRNVAVMGATTLSGALTVDANATFRRDLAVTGATALNGALTVTGAASLATLNVTGVASFSLTTRQMINFWGSTYGIGVHGSTLYQRSGHHFAWYAGGVHHEQEFNPGANGLTTMRLDRDGNLTVAGTVTAPRFIGDGSALTGISTQWSVGGRNISYSAGLVGVGTAAPQRPLHVGGNGGVLALEGRDHAYIEYYPDGFAAGRKAWLGYGNANDNNLTFANDITDAHIVLRPISGNVGVGIDNPQRKLHVRGNGGVLALEGSDQLYVELYRDGFAAGRRAWLGFGGRSLNNLTLTNEIAGAHIVLQPTNGMVAINGALNVTGIASLDTLNLPTGVASFGAAVRQMIHLWNTNYGIGVQNATFYQRSDANYAWFVGGSHHDNSFNPGTNGRMTMGLDNNGNLTITGNAFKPGGGPWAATSDVRLKDDIRQLEGVLAKLLRLRGVSFVWKDPARHGGLTGPQVGMVADEVEQVFPEWVGADPEGHKYLAYRGFEALTVEALRDLKGALDALAARVAALEAPPGDSPARAPRKPKRAELG